MYQYQYISVSVSINMYQYNYISIRSSISIIISITVPSFSYISSSIVSASVLVSECHCSHLTPPPSVDARPRSRRLKTDHPLYRVTGGRHAKEVSTCGVSLSLGHPGVVQAGVEHSVCSSIAVH